jgi:hypothetical protein
MTESLGEKYKEIVPDRKDPMSIEDKTKVKRLLLATIEGQSGRDKDKPEVKANRDAQKFFSKFERPLDAFIVAGYESVFGSESVKQQKGVCNWRETIF